MKSEEFMTNVRSALKVKAELDGGFVPAALFADMFESSARDAGSVPVVISVERGPGEFAAVEAVCFKDEAAWGELNRLYVERLVKTMLWTAGGYHIYVGGPAYLGEYIKGIYTPTGLRAFDHGFMRRVYECELTVTVTGYESAPRTSSVSRPMGRRLGGCRLGFDAGGSDIKISAVKDGEPVFSTEIVWLPKENSDPEYHYKYIVDALKLGAAKLPQVDAVGISSAGIYRDDRAMAASLFIRVNDADFNGKVKDIYIRAVKELGGDIPMAVANDGDVAALAGAMSLGYGSLMGIAMGTSEAAGFVDSEGNITGWLNELAFVPADFNPASMVDEWSGDYGCGVKYFSQDAVAKLAPAAGITFASGMTPAEKLKHVQGLVGNHRGADAIFETIGVYFGHAIAYYARFYELRHVLMLGRVTSGEGGALILKYANAVLEAEYPGLNVKLHIPDERARRVGQSIAAASLP